MEKLLAGSGLSLVVGRWLISLRFERLVRDTQKHPVVHFAPIIPLDCIAGLMTM
jgi:hypothetical protein